MPETVSFPIRMSAGLKKALQQASELTDFSLQDLARLALKIGLEDMRRCNYDLAGAIVDKSEATKESQRSGLMLAAETTESPRAPAQSPTVYQAPKAKQRAS
jgi:hypothetical protein